MGATVHASMEPPSAGQAAELAFIAAFLADAAGTGAALVITGEPGTGKTRLLNIAAEMAAESGAVILRASGVAGGDVPFGGAGLSGIGREGGTWSFDFYADVKNTVYAGRGWRASG